jgi:SPP1 family predicted phage head-tail adaptor
MNAGTLDRRLTLLQWDTSINAIGGVIESWSFYRYSWGRWLPTSGKEFIAAQTRIAELDGVLRMRYRTDIPTTWRILCDGDVYEVISVQTVGRRDAIDIMLKSVPDTETLAPISNIWSIPLLVGDTSKTVKFPVPFASVPQSLDVQLVVPTGEGSFTVTVENLTATGFDAVFSAEVPAAGYSLSVMAFQYATTFIIDLVEGTSDIDVTFALAYPNAPRGLKATLLPPVDGYEFTTALVANGLTASGFNLEFGATVPGAGYRAQIKVSL